MIDPKGKLVKMVILAFETAEDLESGGLLDAKDMYKVLINPESYVTDLKMNTAENQGIGTSGVQSKFASISPEELNLEFLFDNTGIIDGLPMPDGILKELLHFRKVLFKFQGTSHEPYYLKLIWGSLIFKGRALEISITHKLFNAAGLPIRAVAKVKFKASIDDKKRTAEEGRTSPDLTHVRKVKAGDTLPLMCHRIYGDPRHYLKVAKRNNLVNFRLLTPGLELIFPPMLKSDTNGK